MDKLPPFGTILADARRMMGMTRAEFDFELARESLAVLRAIDTATDPYTVAGLHSEPGDREAFDARMAAREAARRHYRPDLDAAIEAAKRKSYTGWSAAAKARGQRVRYAEDV